MTNRGSGTSDSDGDRTGRQVAGVLQRTVNIEADVPGVKLTFYLVTAEQLGMYVEMGFLARCFLAFSTLALGGAISCWIATNTGELSPVSAASLGIAIAAFAMFFLIFAGFSAWFHWREWSRKQDLFATTLAPEPYGEEPVGDIHFDSRPIASGEVGQFGSSRDGPWTPPVVCSPLYREWPPLEGAKWIWISERPTDSEAQRGQTAWHRLEFRLSAFTMGMSGVKLSLLVDDFVDVFVNRKRVGRVVGFSEVADLDLTAYLQQGNNLIEMQVENKRNPQSTGLSNPAGVIYRLDAV